jgi:drug/metabolite transporter (DMT)-like permease
LGIILAVTAALCWGASAIFVRLGLRYIKPITGVFISMLSSLVLVGLLVLSINFGDVVSLRSEVILWFIAIGIITYGIGRLCNFAGVNYIGVTRATPIIASSPLFAMIMAVAFLGEEINFLIVIGTISIVCGLGLLVSSR